MIHSAPYVRFPRSRCWSLHPWPAETRHSGPRPGPQQRPLSPLSCGVATLFDVERVQDRVEDLRGVACEPPHAVGELVGREADEAVDAPSGLNVKNLIDVKIAWLIPPATRHGTPGDGQTTSSKRGKAPH